MSGVESKTFSIKETKAGLKKINEAILKLQENPMSYYINDFGNSIVANMFQEKINSLSTDEFDNMVQQDLERLYEIRDELNWHLVIAKKHRRKKILIAGGILAAILTGGVILYVVSNVGSSEKSDDSYDGGNDVVEDNDNYAVVTDDDYSVVSDDGYVAVVSC